MADRPDHRPYAEGPAQLAFGLGADDRLFHVRDVPSGAACNCVCPACGRRLVARRATTWHFAHQPGADCPRAYESMLHRLAKEVLEEALRLKLPAVRVEGGGTSVQTHPAREMNFDTARLEASRGAITPDIVVTHQGRELFVEIFVTHACDEDKVAKLRQGGVASIEIDLSKLPRGADRGVVRQAVLWDAPRRWLYNPKLDAAVAIHEAKLAEAEAERLRKLARVADRLAQHWDRLSAAAARPATSTQMALRAHLGDLGLNHLVGALIEGQAGFLVDCSVWQAEIVKRVIVSPPTFWGPVKGVGAKALTKALFDQGLIDPLFDQERTLELIKLVRERRPDFAPPVSLVRTYLGRLAKQDYVICQEGAWRASERVRQDVVARKIALEEERDRADDLRNALADILAKLGPSGFAFNEAAWRDRGLAHWGRTANEIARGGGADWSELQEAFRNIERAFSTGSAPETLGLPVMPAIRAAARARAEAVEARRLKEEQARLEAEANAAADADAREARARMEGAPLLDLDAFLEAPYSDAQSGSRLAHIRASDAGFWRVQGQLEAKLDAQRQAERRKAVADEELDTLRRAAVAVRDEVWAKLFLLSPRKELGGLRPMDVCIDAEGRKRCEKLLVKEHRVRG